ncbi:hypothetical protein ABK040_001812 [Willaertia magna]
MRITKLNVSPILKVKGHLNNRCLLNVNCSTTPFSSSVVYKSNNYYLLYKNVQENNGVQKRFYSAEEEEEEDEETKLRRKLANLPKPKIDPLVIPRRRRGLTVETFLKAIGKGCEEHVDKFTSWDDLFLSKSQKLKKKEIPVAQRRWILKWLEKYRQGETPGFQ